MRISMLASPRPVAGSERDFAVPPTSVAGSLFRALAGSGMAFGGSTAWDPLQRAVSVAVMPSGASNERPVGKRSPLTPYSATPLSLTSRSWLPSRPSASADTLIVQLIGGVDPV